MHKVISSLILLAVYATGVSGTTGVGAQAPYSAVRTGDVVTLQDARAGIVVPVVTTLSNPYEMVVKSQQIIRKTFADVDAFRARPGLNGVPLLAPFANRLDEQAFYANGNKYSFDSSVVSCGLLVPGSPSQSRS